LLSEGKTLTEAVKIYEKFSNETQQSSDLSQMSLFQRGGSFAKLFTMFMSSQRQYLNKEVNAVRSLFKKGGMKPNNVAKVARVMFIYHVLLPVIFQMVANFGRWDDEAIKDYIRAGLLGSANGLFIFGQVVDGVLRASLGLKVWDVSLPIIDQMDKIQRAITSVDLDDISIDDLKDGMGALSEAASVVGLPTEQVVDIVDGVKDLLNHDFKEGIGQILGWSEYSITGQSQKKKTNKSSGRLAF